MSFFSSLLPASPLLIGLLALLLLAFGFHFGVRLARVILRRRVARTRRVGRRGEARALKVLDYEGYRILEQQVVRTGALEVDGERRVFSVRADALVRRRRHTYVAELKGGLDVARVTNRDTRRQLLEYATVFDVDGVLLVDGERGRISRITFPRMTLPRG